jgi:oligopeptide transport system substrate-binding protein
VNPPHPVLFWALIGLLGWWGLLGCRSPKDALDPSTLSVGNEAEPATLDPQLATGQPEIRLLGALVEGLVVRSQIPGQVFPGLAQSWEVDSSGRHYRFHLRKTRWSDGSPFRAQQMVDSWRRFADPKTAAEYSSLLRVLKNGDPVRLGQLPLDSLGIEAPDDTTFIAHLENPAHFFLDLCGFEPFAPVPVDTILKFGPQWTHPGKFVGLGAFQMVSWKPNQAVVVEKNPNYWDSASVRLNRIRFRSIEDQMTAFQMARNFELDWTFNIPKSRLQQAKSLPEFYSAPMYGTYYLIVNCKKPGFDKKALRRALAYSIDRERIVSRILKGIGAVATGYVPGTANYPELHSLRYDTVYARQLLAESGFSETNPPEGLQILFNNSEVHKTIAEVVQQMWKTNLGLSAELVNYEWKVYLENTKNLNYSSLARASWIGDFSDPISFLELYTTTSGNNRTGYSNPTYDSLISESWREANPIRRMDILRQAEALLMEDMPIIPIYHYALTELRSLRLQNAIPNPLGLYAWKTIALGASR